MPKTKPGGDPDIDKRGALDFYNDLVAPTLNEDIDVETWERAKGKTPEGQEHEKKHDVENMQYHTDKPDPSADTTATFLWASRPESALPVRGSRRPAH